MIPDYSKPSLISISTEEGSISFTAPSNGYIIGSGFGDGQAKNFLYLHCGDVSIRQQGNSNENIGSIFPVKKGDIVGINFCFSQKNNGIYFVPTVWLNSKAFFTAKVSTNDKDTICVIPKDTSHFSFMAFGDYNTSYFYAFASLSAQISSVGEGSIKYANGRFEVKLSNWSYVSIISAMDFTCEVK